MIAEPYICIKGPRLGEIESYEQYPLIPNGLVYLSKDCSEMRMLDLSEWKRYADFEREKLKGLDGHFVIDKLGIRFLGVRSFLWSNDLIRYCGVDYENDSESNRLLARARFLKAVCEKENVPWLPQSEQQQETFSPQCRIKGLSDHSGIKRMIEEKVVVNDETSCWEWGGARNYQGYGKQTIKRSELKTFQAHRLAAMVYLGFDIDSEELVCHKCDNPPCCNPDHLFIGDYKTNAEDMVAKGRAVDVSNRQRSGGGTFLPKAA